MPTSKSARPSESVEEKSSTKAPLPEPGQSQVFRASFPDDAEPSSTGFRTRAWKHGLPKSSEELTPLVPDLLEALRLAAQAGPRLGITLVPERADQEETFLSYKALEAASARVATRLVSAGLLRDERALMVMPTCLEFVIDFFAILKAGGVPVPTYPPMHLRAEGALDRLVHIADHAKVGLCVATRKLKTVLGELHLKVDSLREVLTAEDLDEEGLALTTHRPRPTDPAFIQYTSGSTGTPKGVLLTHRNLTANVHAIGQALQIRRTDRVASWLPLYHDMGLIGTLLFSIYWRIPLALMSPTTFLGRPRRWLETITKHRCTLSPAPNFAYALCVKRIAPADRKGLDLSSWRLAMNGAEPVNLRTLIDFEEAYRPFGFRGESMLPVYGLAESSLAVTFPRPGTPVKHLLVDRAALANGYVVPSSGRQAVAMVSTGWAVPGHEVKLVNEHGREVGETAVGHILVKGPSVMAGYYQNAEASLAVLRDGWLWTGDLGFVLDGMLYVSGRAKDLIILRGKNYYPEDIERIAERVDGVRAGGSVAFGVLEQGKDTELCVLVAETRLSDEAERKALAKAISDRVAEFAEVRLDEVVLVNPGTLPKTSSGKKQRGLTRERYLRGELVGRRKSSMNTAMVFARSGAGFVLAKAKRLLGKRSEPA